jgi:predicted nucleic acid-binding protein
MPQCFLDTSALVKYYHNELGSAHVIALIDDPANTIWISRLSLIEMHSAVARQVREGRLPALSFHQWRRRFFADVRSRKFRIVRAMSSQEREAMRLLVRYGTVIPLRTLDAMQLAVALWLRDRGHLDQFVCADAWLCEAAQREGLAVLNPERF